MRSAFAFLITYLIVQHRFFAGAGFLEVGLWSGGRVESDKARRKCLLASVITILWAGVTLALTLAAQLIGENVALEKFSDPWGVIDVFIMTGLAAALFYCSRTAAVLSVFYCVAGLVVTLSAPNEIGGGNKPNYTIFLCSSRAGRIRLCRH